MDVLLELLSVLTTMVHQYAREELCGHAFPSFTTMAAFVTVNAAESILTVPNQAMTWRDVFLGKNARRWTAKQLAKREQFGTATVPNMATECAIATAVDGILTATLMGTIHLTANQGRHAQRLEDSLFAAVVRPRQAATHSTQRAAPLDRHVTTQAG